MIALSRRVTCQQIMAAAREQAWANRAQVLGLPTRLGDEPTYTRHWDLTAIADVLNQATALQWGPDELTARTPDGLSYHFAIMRPGRTAVPQTRTEVCWQVVGPDGVTICRFCDRDIDLADALYRSSPPGSHLMKVLATAGGR